MSKIITLTPEQIKAHPLIRKKGNKDIPILFYDFLAEHEHIPDNTMILCTHVNIAKNSEPLHILRHVASTVHLSEQSNSLYIRLRLSKTYELTSK